MTVLFGLYVLSIGPMYWYWYFGKFGNGSLIVAAFYEPLFLMANQDDSLNLSQAFGEWLNSYISLWVNDQTSQAVDRQSTRQQAVQLYSSGVVQFL